MTNEQLNLIANRIARELEKKEVSLIIEKKMIELEPLFKEMDLLESRSKELSKKIENLRNEIRKEAKTETYYYGCNRENIKNALIEDNKISMNLIKEEILLSQQSDLNELVSTVVSKLKESK